jgi:hypothetical protein
VPYRQGDASTREIVVVTKTVGSVPIAVLFIGLIALVLGLVVQLSAARGPGVVRLACDDGGSCEITEPHGNVTRLEADVPYVIAIGAADKLGSPIPDTYFVRIMGGSVSASIGVRTRQNAEALIATLTDAMKRRAATRAAWTVGGDAAFPAFAMMGLGVLLASLFFLARGAYRFVIDPARGELSVARHRGFVPKTNVHAPLDTIAEIVAVSQTPDAAFARYDVVLRDRAGNVTKAFRAGLKRADAFAIANQANDALTDHRAK